MQATSGLGRGNAGPAAGRSPSEQAAEARGKGFSHPLHIAKLKDVEAKVKDIEKLQEDRWQATQAWQKKMEDFVNQNCRILRQNSRATTDCDQEPSDIKQVRITSPGVCVSRWLQRGSFL